MYNQVIGEANFKFSSRFSQLIGRNLISNPVVAVSELVKNSYDADATSVMVTMKIPSLNIICFSLYYTLFLLSRQCESGTGCNKS